MKALVDEAIANGASKLEVRQIINDYYGQKKKEKTSASGSLLAQEVSTDSTSSIDVSSREASGNSGTVPSVNIVDPYSQESIDRYNARAETEVLTSYLYDGNDISKQDADIITAYTDTYQNSLENYFDINFNSDRYYEATGRPQAAQRWRSASNEEQRMMNASLMASIKSRSGEDGDGNKLNPYNDDSVLEELLKGSDNAFSSGLQMGDDDSVAESISVGGRGRGLSAMGATGNPLYTAFGQEIVEGAESLAGLSEEQIQDKNKAFKESAREQYYQRRLSAAKARLMTDVNSSTNDAIKGTLSADFFTDEENVRNLERHLLEEYDIMADLNDTGYIGDTSEGRNVTADFFRGLGSEVVKIVGTLGVGLEDFGVNAVELAFGEWAYGKQKTDMHRKAYKELSNSIDRYSSTPQVDPASKFENGDWSGGMADVVSDFGHSVPMMAAAIVTQRLTGNSKLTAGVVAGMGSLTAYDIARDEEWFNKMNVVQQGGFVLGYGVAEGAPAFVGAKIFDRFKGLRANSKGAADFIYGAIMNTPLAMGEEAITEAVTGGMQYVIEQNAKGQDIDVVQMDKAIKNGFYAGAVMGGGIAGAGSSVGALGLAASSIPSIQSKLVIQQLKKELDAQETVSGRREVMARLVGAIQKNESEGKKRRDYYEELRQSDPEAYSTLVDIQTQITKKAIDYERTENKSQRRRLRNEVNGLVKQRAKLETDLDVSHDLGSRTTTNQIMDNVSRVLEEYSLDTLFEGKESVVVDEANSDNVLDRINNLLLDKMALNLPLGLGRISSPQAVMDGLRNTITAVKTLSKTKKGFKGIMIHKTIASMANSVPGGKVGRGVYVAKQQDGGYKIHLLVPAILENTAYHEGYHELGLDAMLGDEALVGLATELAQSLQGEGVANKFGKYLSRVLQSERVQEQLTALGIDGTKETDIVKLMQSAAFADEFLTELLADISAGNLSIEVKRGLIERFSGLINRGLSPLPFVGKIPTPGISDVGRAIENLTGRMASGEDVTEAVAGLSKATEGLNLKPEERQVSDDEEVRFQGELDESLRTGAGLESFLSTANLTEEQLTELKSELKLDKNQRLDRVPRNVEAIEAMKEGTLTQEQYIEVVRGVMPITPFDVVPDMPTLPEIGAALKSSQLETGIYDLNKELPEGYFVGLRLDIPAYNTYDVWVASVHEGNKTASSFAKKIGDTSGKAVAYSQTGVIKGVKFGGSPIGSLSIATRTNKTTIARMFGDWVNHDPATIKAKAEKIMASKEYHKDHKSEGVQEGWVQVGMNPYRHSWFYDKRDGMPVTEASELIQIGALVLAKDTKKVLPSDPMFDTGKTTPEGVPIKFQDALAEPSPENDPKFGPKLMGEFARSIKKQTIKGTRIGQGYGTAKSSKLDDSYILSLAHVKENEPKIYVKNALFLSQLDIVAGVRKFRNSVFEGKDAMKYADEVYDIFIEEAKNNLLFLHDAFEADLREVATLWYDGANIIAQQLAEEYDIDPIQVAAAIAALSPQKDWYQNVRLGEVVIEAVVNNGNKPVTQEMVDFFMNAGGAKVAWARELSKYIGTSIVELPPGNVRAMAVWAFVDLNMSRSYDIITPSGERGGKKTNLQGKESRAAWSSLTMIDKAVSALLTEDVAEISRVLGEQHKIRHFFNNIHNPGFGSDTTIDTHAVGAALLKPMSSSSGEVGANFGATGGTFIDKNGVVYGGKEVANLAKAAGIKVKGVADWKPWALKKGFAELKVSNSSVHAISGNYYAYLEAYRIAAEERGLLPREMQSITWEAVRLLYTAGFKNSEANKSRIQSLHTKYRNAEITREQLREGLLKEAGGIGTPDWAPAIRDAVSKIGREQPESRDVDRSGGASGREGTRGGGTSRSAGDVSGEVKFQGDLTRQIADFLDKEYSNPTVKRDKRRKNPVRLEASIGQMATMAYAKPEILKLLQDMGMSKEAALAAYRRAYDFKRGRLIGKKEVNKKVRKLTTEAKNLRTDLEQLRDKSKNYKEFLREAIEIVKERMKENSKTPFTSSQVQKLFKIAREAHRVSGKRVKAEGFEVMQTFIDKLSAVFDARDTKKAMQEYLDQVNRVRGLQKRLGKAAKPRKAGEALKSTATYNKYAEALAKINPALLDNEDITTFEQTLLATLGSMKAPQIKKGEDGREAVSFPKLPAEDLAVLVAQFQSKETLGRNAVFAARAERLALKNNTTVDEEYNKIKAGYERSQLSQNRKNILRYIDEWNKNNVNDQLDSSNPAHLERVLEALYNEKSGKNEEESEMIVDDVMLPRIAANLDVLLEEPMIADILGIADPSKLNFADLKNRLLKLNRRQLAHLDYKLDDFIVNGSVFGLGYVHSLVRGNIDYASDLASLKKEGLQARPKVYMGFLDTVDSYIRMAFSTDDITIARLRRSLGFGSIEGAFGRADFRHSMLVEKMSEKVEELERKSKKKITGVRQKAIMQIFSMSRQVPVIDNETQEGQNAAEWFVNLKGVMQRTIEYHNQQQVAAGGAFSKAEIAEMQEAYDFMFGDTNSLQELQAKVKSESPELVQFVDFMVDMHVGLIPQFSNYVERYLGKELVMEDNYTPFDVRIQTKNDVVNETMRMFEGFHKALTESALGQTKKVAGSSFERNPRSLSGSKAIIGLDFLRVNESTLRENVTLMETVGSTLSHRFVMNSQEATDLIPNTTVKQALERKISKYVHQDTGKVPAVFQKDFVLFGKRFENPSYIIRLAVITKAFGGFLIQTAKQSPVILNTFFQAKNPLKTFPYVLQTVAEMVYHSGKGLFMADSKIALDNNGRYRLLQNSPVFSRDYEAGNIDPFTGSMEFDATQFQKVTEYLNKLALKNLKGTDKVVAIASWFGFYADALIEQGVVDSVSDIDWEQEAVSPNKEALSYADSLVTKDQAASTPRQAADLYAGGSDFAPQLAYLMQNFLLPFSRFAVNKKRSITSDVKKIFYGSGKAKGEGGKALVGSVAELATFHMVGKILLPAIVSAIFGDDEDQLTEEDKQKAWWDVGASTLVDFLPQIPLAMIDNSMRFAVNKYLIFPLLEEDNFGIGEESYDERYERWSKVKGGVPIYGSRTEPGDPMSMLSYVGPYGQFLTESHNTMINVISMSSGSNKVVTSTGREYFVRPEDRPNMAMYFYMKLAMTGGNLIGFGNKEAEQLIKTLDNMGKERALGSEEDLAAYEVVADALAASDPQFSEAVKNIDEKGGRVRFLKLMEEAGADPQQADKVANAFSKGFNQPIAETAMRKRFPDTFKKHIGELREIQRRVKNSRDYYVVMRAKALSMNTQDYKELSEMAQAYFSMLEPSKIETDIYLQALEE